MEGNTNKAKRFSLFFIAVISVLLVLSFISLYQALEVYQRTGSPDYVTIMMSVGAIALSSYMVLQMRRKPMKLGFEQPKVFSTVQCLNCDYKNIREFLAGDYVLKSDESCPKCSGETVIQTIYRESEDKE